MSIEHGGRGRGHEHNIELGEGRVMSIGGWGGGVVMSIEHGVGWG